jgi:hypothetical protein
MDPEIVAALVGAGVVGVVALAVQGLASWLQIRTIKTQHPHERALADADSRRRVMLDVRMKLLEREMSEADAADAYVRCKVRELRGAYRLAVGREAIPSPSEQCKHPGIACPLGLSRAIQFFDDEWIDCILAAQRARELRASEDHDDRVESDDARWAREGIDRLEIGWRRVIADYRSDLHLKRARLEADIVVPDVSREAGVTEVDDGPDAYVSPFAPAKRARAVQDYGGPLAAPTGEADASQLHLEEGSEIGVRAQSQPKRRRGE